MKKLETFYKIATPSGWDFYTGKIINYRENIGSEVTCPKFDKDGYLCSTAFIHASRDPNQCFIGGTIPCSIYLVRGEVIKEDSRKCGFQKLFIEKELNPKEVFKWNYEEACNPIHPFKIKPPKKITKEHVALVKQWDSVRASVWASVRSSVRASVGDSIWDSVRASVRASVRDSVRVSVGDSIWNSVWDSVWDSIWASVGVSVGDSVWDSVWDSIWASVLDSVWDSIGAYVGSLFISCVKKWKYINHKKGEYPFQPAVDLWRMGLVPSWNGEKWRLHGNREGRVLREEE